MANTNASVPPAQAPGSSRGAQSHAAHHHPVWTKILTIVASALASVAGLTIVFILNDTRTRIANVEFTNVTQSVDISRVDERCEAQGDDMAGLETEIRILRDTLQTEIRLLRQTITHFSHDRATNYRDADRQNQAVRSILHAVDALERRSSKSPDPSKSDSQ